MAAGPVMIKILVLGTLLIGSLVLLANFLPGARPRHSGSRRAGPVATVTAFGGRTDTGAAGSGSDPTGKIRKTAEQWRAELTEEQYRVTRCSATERPFTGRYWNHRAKGTYQCVGCGQDLFDSNAKFDAGTGWPSYMRPAADGAVDEIKDISYGMIRTEVVCSRCEAHLGHVFADGPAPTGRRYCINSAALAFAGENGTGQIDPPQRAAGE